MWLSVNGVEKSSRIIQCLRWAINGWCYVQKRMGVWASSELNNWKGTPIKWPIDIFARIFHWKWTNKSTHFQTVWEKRFIRLFFKWYRLLNTKNNLIALNAKSGEKKGERKKAHYRKFTQTYNDLFFFCSRC